MVLQTFSWGIHKVITIACVWRHILSTLCRQGALDGGGDGDTERDGVEWGGGGGNLGYIISQGTMRRSVVGFSYLTPTPSPGSACYGEEQISFTKEADGDR